MGYKVVITGATGMVGQGVLMECLDHQDIDAVLLVNRTPLKSEHKKIREIIVKDFFDLGPLQDQMKDYDGCFFCLGTSSVGQSESEYSRITFELTLIFAKLFYKQSPDSVFCYVSGAGTDSSEKGRSMWARVKGKTENRLMEIPFKKSYMFRPGFIQPLRGIRSKTSWYAALYTIFRPLYQVLKHFPSTATNTTNMGLAMISTLDGQYPSQILENKQINELAKHQLSKND